MRFGVNAAADGIGEGFELPFVGGEKGRVFNGRQKLLRWRCGVDWVAGDQVGEDEQRQAEREIHFALATKTGKSDKESGWLHTILCTNGTQTESQQQR